MKRSDLPEWIVGMMDELALMCDMCDCCMQTSIVEYAAHCENFVVWHCLLCNCYLAEPLDEFASRWEKNSKGEK